MQSTRKLHRFLENVLVSFLKPSHRVKENHKIYFPRISRYIHRIYFMSPYVFHVQLNENRENKIINV